MPSKKVDEITYPFPNFNTSTVAPLKSKRQWLHRWSLEKVKKFRSTFYNGCDYLSILELKLNHVS